MKLFDNNFGLPASLIATVAEALKGNQKKIDVNKNGKIDADDLQKLRSEATTTDPDFYYPPDRNLPNPGKKSPNEPTYTGPKEAPAPKAPTDAPLPPRRPKTNEEVKSIDELSKKTLGSYIPKAAQSAANFAYTAGVGDPGGQEINTDDNHAWAQKRLKGIAKASQKMTKEEVESIDELSKKTLRSYAQKSLKQVDMAARMSNNGQKSGMSAIANKRREGVSTAINKLANEDFTLEDFSLEEIEEFMVSEDFEQLDELSKKTLRSYKKKAIKSKPKAS